MNAPKAQRAHEPPFLRGSANADNSRRRPGSFQSFGKHLGSDFTVAGQRRICTGFAPRNVTHPKVSNSTLALSQARFSESQRGNQEVFIIHRVLNPLPKTPITQLRVESSPSGPFVGRLEGCLHRQPLDRRPHWRWGSWNRRLPALAVWLGFLTPNSPRLGGRNLHFAYREP